uniref:Putative neurotoxin LTDF S-06 n=1 Tax=Dolomedes fimbriatus TaxID=1432569 RepID=A0A0K1D8H2_9ARAC|nr:putative neurotoxin LTDF S-06 [Dolomedes fimbriatus]
MWVKIQLFLFAAILITQLEVHADQDSSENTEMARKTCAGLYKECDAPRLPCCENRVCKCSFAFTNCKCHKRPSQLIADMFSGK